jgi:hypothetical protein
MPGDQIEAHLIDLVLEVSTCQTQTFGGAPKRGIVAFNMDMVACPIFYWGHKAVVCMHIDRAHVGMGWRSPCRYIRS